MSVTSTLNTEVLEGGTIIISASFTDENGNAATPSELSYTLYNHANGVINGKENVSITPDTAVSVTLYGDDLPSGNLFFLVEGKYNSDAGSDLPIKAYAKFDVEPKVR